MHLASVAIKNFRANRDLRAPCRHLTAFVGPNGAGKSSILNALNVFFHPGQALTDGDFYNRDTSTPIEVACTFANLPVDAPPEWQPYIREDPDTHERVLQVTADIEYESKKARVTYFGERLVNKEFDSVRFAGAAPNVERAYRVLRDSGRYPTLPNEKAKGTILSVLDSWEADPTNQERLEPGLDSGSFFSVGGGGPGDLGRYIEYVLVPAVLDATDEVGTQKGSMAQLLQQNILNPLLARPELREIEQEAEKRLADVLRRPQEQASATLEASLNAELGGLAKNTLLSFDWADGRVSIAPPSATPRLSEDGFKTGVGGAGHGAQRALILTSIKHRASLPPTSPEDSGDDGTASTKKLILAVEEPELFQHPNRQRHFADVLRNIAGADGRQEDERVQVLLVTHSPLFVNLQYFDCIRRTTKLPQPEVGAAPATTVAHADWASVAENLWRLCGASGAKFSEKSFRTRLEGVMTPWLNEGFFAKRVVLVEGESDRAVLLAVAADMGVNLEELEISVLPCGGKTKLDRPYLVFTELGIPTYLLWDSDDTTKEEDKELNTRLFRLAGSDLENGGDVVEAGFACFGVKLEAYLRDVADAVKPSLYQHTLDKAKADFGYKKNQEALKNPLLVAAFYRDLKAAGARFEKIEQMVRAVLDMNAPTLYRPT